MKLLAAFWLALAVVAVDKTASDWPLEVTTGNPVSGLEDLFGKFGCKISVAVDPEEVFPLVRDCLKTDESLLPKNLLEMDAVHVAAFIFMLRAQGKEGAAECLYNFIVKERFPVKFKAELHKRLYIAYPREYFNSLTKEDDKQFFMLWTVQMYDKRQQHESEDDHRMRLLRCSEEVMLILVKMGIPLGLQLGRVVLLPRKFPANRKLKLLTSFQLMLVSFTGDEYLELGEPEQMQLLTFLWRYLRFKWNNGKIPAERLLKQEFERFQQMFDLEDSIRDEGFMPGDISKLVKYLCCHLKLGCPAFLLERKFDVYSRGILLDETALGRRHYLLRALVMARGMMGNDVHFRMGRKMKCQDEELACSQIKRAIDECNEEIDKFFENPEARAKWEKTLSRGLGTKLRKKSKKACADLKLPN